MKITPEIIKKATKLLSANSHRKKSNSGIPGGLIDLTKDKRKLLLVGDLHGAFDNLINIIEDEKNRIDLAEGNSILVIIGDGIHNDQTGQMLEMQSSLLVFEEIIKLLVTYEGSVIYIRGNHDTFNERLAKSGIQQGKEFKKFLMTHRDEKYVDAVQDFFEKLPLAIIGQNYVIVHAGPIRGGCTRDELINVYSDLDLCHQLMWNRVHELRGTPSLKEYDGSDIKKMIARLDLPEDSYFIVGHNPMWNTGNRTGIWKNVTGINNHYIIVSNIQTQAPYLTILNGKIDEKFATAIKAERSYV